LRELLSLVFGPQSISIIVADANTASRDLTADQMNGIITISAAKAPGRDLPSQLRQHEGRRESRGVDD